MRAKALFQRDFEAAGTALQLADLYTSSRTVGDSAELSRDGTFALRLDEGGHEVVPLRSMYRSWWTKPPSRQGALPVVCDVDGPDDPERVVDTRLPLDGGMLAGERPADAGDGPPLVGLSRRTAGLAALLGGGAVSPPVVTRREPCGDLAPHRQCRISGSSASHQQLGRSSDQKTLQGQEETMTSTTALRRPEVTASAPAVALRNVRKVYGRGDGTVVALDGVSVGLAPGSFTAIMGPSGSGKSTFLNVAAGLDRPTEGSVFLGETELGGLSEQRLTVLRRERIGFVFQAFNLLPSLTVAQNIGLPLRLDGRRAGRSAVREVAARVGMEHRLRHRPAQLSGGQQQRVAIARALVTRPEVLFADEPTGALDVRAGRDVLALLRQLVDNDAHTVVMVTHDPTAAAHADRVILLADGRVAGTLDAPSADQVAEELAHLGG
jgi:putative ABC transport system ATP-binding protein